MRFEDIPKYDQYIYQKKCEKCEYILNISTQRDNCPAYYKEVYFQCECGNWVEFDLPVN